MEQFVYENVLAAIWTFSIFLFFSDRRKKPKTINSQYKKTKKMDLLIVLRVLFGSFLFVLNQTTW